MAFSIFLHRIVGFAPEYLHLAHIEINLLIYVFIETHWRHGFIVV